LIDPVWQSGHISRPEFYRALSDAIGYKFHTADIRDIEEARQVYRVARRLIASDF
jgi:hypothetical protein